MNLINWRAAFWLLTSTVLVPALLAISVGILILVFYREAWDVAFGVLVLCFAVFAVAGSSITVFLLKRTARLAELQSEFLANMSHDFRTPLTSIRMFVDTLRSGRASPEEHERCLEILSDETERMERLVGRVLTFRHMNRASSGALSFQLDKPAELLESALAPLRVDDEWARRLEVVVEPRLPSIMVDRDAVVEAVRNIAANALKYTRGAVVASGRIDGNRIEFAIRDEGPRIPRRERRRIFRRFYRMHGTDGPGTGLGLAIAKHAALAHGGRVELQAAEPIGNVFTFWIPVEKGNVKAGLKERTPSAETGDHRSPTTRSDEPA